MSVHVILSLAAGLTLAPTPRITVANGAANAASGILLPDLGAPTFPSGGGPKGPSEYQLNLGQAVDALRFSYPHMLTREPDDLSVFLPNLVFRSGSGPSPNLQGLSKYRQMLAAMRVAVAATTSSSEMTYRLVVSGDCIRVRWCAKFYLKDPAWELRALLQQRQPTPLQVDGVSVYSLDSVARIHEHRLENIVLSSGDDTAHAPVREVWLREMVATAV